MAANVGFQDIPRRTAEVRKVRRATGTCCREARVRRERWRSGSVTMRGKFVSVDTHRGPDRLGHHLDGRSWLMRGLARGWCSRWNRSVVPLSSRIKTTSVRDPGLALSQPRDRSSELRFFHLDLCLSLFSALDSLPPPLLVSRTQPRRYSSHSCSDPSTSGTLFVRSISRRP